MTDLPHLSHIFDRLKRGCPLLRRSLPIEPNGLDVETEREALACPFQVDNRGPDHAIERGGWVVERSGEAREAA